MVLKSPVAGCFTGSDNRMRATFKICFRLENCPSDDLPRGKRLDVVVKALEEITVEPLLLHKATVYLNYFVISKSDACLVQSLHYDFGEQGKDNHPLFHVQVTNELISESDLRATDFGLRVSSAQSNMHGVTTRIPTPDMTLASVLYCLVADHSKADIFIPFAERIHSIQDRLPPPCFDMLQKSLQKSKNHFKSSHWFAHMWGQ